MARLTPTARAAGLGHLFDVLETPLFDVGLDGFVRNLKTLADYFLVIRPAGNFHSANSLKNSSTIE